MAGPAFAPTARADDPVACGASDAPVPLALGVATTVVAPSTDAASDCHFLVTLSGDLTGMRLNVSAATTEDHDLYVGRGVTPAATSSSCTYLGNGKSSSAVAEACVLQWPLAAGDYVVRLHRNVEGAGQATLTARLVAAPSGNTLSTGSCLNSGATANSFAVPDLTANVASASNQVGSAVGSRCVYRFVAPAGLDALTATFSALTTSGHVSMRRDYAPSPTVGGQGDNACSAQGSAFGSATSCSVTGITTDGSGVWYLAVDRVTAVSSTSAQTMRAIPVGCGLGRGLHPLDVALNTSSFLYQGAGSACYFSLAHDEAKSLVKATMLPTGANFDLRLRRDVLPTTSASECASTASTSGALERCSLRWAGATQLVAMVNRPTAAAAGSGTHAFTLETAALAGCTPEGGATTLVDAEPATATLANETDAACFFTYTPDPEASVVRVSLSPVTTGLNPDLYVNTTAQPVVTSGNACAAAATNGTDLCELSNTGAPVYVMVRRASGAGDFSLVARSISPCSFGNVDLALADGVSQTATLTADQGGKCNFYLDVPASGDSLVATMAPGAGSDFDLYVKKGARPTASSYDCRANSAGDAAESCALTLGAGRYYLQVVNVAGAGDFSLVASGPSACSLGVGPVTLNSGEPISGSLLDAANAACTFMLDASADTDAVSATLTPATGNLDLYVRKGSAPTTSSYDCRSIQIGTALDACVVSLDSGRYHLRVTRTAGGGAFTLVADAISTCSLGTAATTLAEGVSASGSLADLSGAKCYFAFTPGAPLADPLHPGKDVLNLSLAATDAASNFDLYVKKGAIPTTSSRDCASTKAAGIADGCELVVADGSTYYAMVRRTAGSGGFGVAARMSSSCGLGEGMHPLPNGQDVPTHMRGLAGAKCYFSLSSTPKDDLLQVLQSADTTNSAYAMTLYKDVAPGGNATCASSSYYYSIVGLVLTQLAECDQLLEDGVAHAWYVVVARSAGGSAGADTYFTVNGKAQAIPTLLAGVPQKGHVDTGGTQYWKVVLPQGATSLAIQTAGDATNVGCATGAQANPTVSTACLLLPFPTLIGCALVQADTGVSCDQTEQTFYQRCVGETADAATCNQLEQSRLDACAAANEQDPGSCAPSDTTGSLSATCRVANKATNDTKCSTAVSVKTTEMDMLVRYRGGLPTSSAYDCRSAQPGAIERCVFSAAVKDAHDNTTEPNRATANGAIQDGRRSASENRTTADQADANATRSAQENRSATLEPQWTAVRDAGRGQGHDPGALPATPGTGLPGTPNAAVSDQADAKPLPGAGKYFIAVRGPLDLVSSLYYTGGDYVIVAAYDNATAPTLEQVGDQASQTSDELGLPAAPASAPQLHAPRAGATPSARDVVAAAMARFAGWLHASA